MLCIFFFLQNVVLYYYLNFGVNMLLVFIKWYSLWILWSTSEIVSYVSHVKHHQCLASSVTMQWYKFNSNLIWKQKHVEHVNKLRTLFAGMIIIVLRFLLFSNCTVFLLYLIQRHNDLNMFHDKQTLRLSVKYLKSIESRFR